MTWRSQKRQHLIVLAFVTRIGLFFGLATVSGDGTVAGAIGAGIIVAALTWIALHLAGRARIRKGAVLLTDAQLTHARAVVKRADPLADPAVARYIAFEYGAALAMSLSRGKRALVVAAPLLCATAALFQLFDENDAAAAGGLAVLGSIFVTSAWRLGPNYRPTRRTWERAIDAARAFLEAQVVPTSGATETADLSTAGLGSGHRSATAIVDDRPMAGPEPELVDLPDLPEPVQAPGRWGILYAVVATIVAVIVLVVLAGQR
jgi:hypothetical protein